MVLISKFDTHYHSQFGIIDHPRGIFFEQKQFWKWTRKAYLNADGLNIEFNTKW